jgi:hypothetical protein
MKEPVERSGSIKHAVVDEAVQPAAPPKLARSTAKPTPHVEEYVTSAVLIVRTDPTADASFAAIFDRIKFGIAIAAMIKMIATTINNSISEKPLCFLIIVVPVSSERLGP